MGIELEFEIHEEHNTGRVITYRVERKGLMVGLLLLNEPYTKEKAKSTKMRMN